MPNWCSNSITISNPKKFKEECLNEDGQFFFSNIIKQPEHIRLFNTFSFGQYDFERMEEDEVKSENIGNEQLCDRFFLRGMFDYLYALPFMEAEEERTGIRKDGWYDWNCENYGTKWDLDGNDVVVDELDEMIEKDDSYTFSFDTAWTPPLPALQKLAEMGINFAWSCEEDGCGIFMEGDGFDGNFSAHDTEPPEDYYDEYEEENEK